MAYHVNLYLLVFLPAVVLIYTLVPQKFRRVVVLLANAAFYLSVSRHLIVFILGTAVFTYAIGRQIESAAAAEGDRQTEGALRSKRWLLIGIAALIAVLAYLKYTNFFLANVNRLAQHLTGTAPFSA